MEKVLIKLKNITFIKKLPISKVESFLKSNFWPKSNMQNSAYTKPLNLELNASDLPYIFIEAHGNTLES